MHYHVGKYRVTEDIKEWNLDCEKTTVLKEGEIVSAFVAFSERGNIDAFHTKSSILGGARFSYTAKPHVELVEVTTHLTVQEYFDKLSEYRSEWFYNGDLEVAHEVSYIVEKDIYWDNHGRETKVFREGERISGEGYFCPNKILKSITAESIIYKGVSDYVDISSIALAYVGPEIVTGDVEAIITSDIESL